MTQTILCEQNNIQSTSYPLFCVQNSEKPVWNANKGAKYFTMQCTNMTKVCCNLLNFTVK